MKTSYFAPLARCLLLLTGIPALAADAPAPLAAPANAPATDAAATPQPDQAGQISIVYFIGGFYNSEAETILDTHSIPYQQGLTLGQVIKDEGEKTKDMFRLSVESGYGGRRMGGRMINLPDFEAGRGRDILLSPGDVVRIHAPFIHVSLLGFDGEIPYQPGMTLGQVIQSPKVSAEKSLKWADLGKIQVGKVITNPQNDVSDTSSATVDYTAISSGRAQDIPVSPHDTVSIPPKPFVFDGGSPQQVINAIHDFFGEDLGQTSIPPEMADIQVPKFEISQPMDPHEVLQLYNQMGEKIPLLGQWFWGQFDPEKTQTQIDVASWSTPGLLMLVPDRSVAQAEAEKLAVKAKAISVAAVPADKWADLQSAIFKADDAAEQYIHRGGKAPDARSGTLQLQSESKILIVIGPTSFIELAESVVEAYEKTGQWDHALQLFQAGLGPFPH